MIPSFMGDYDSFIKELFQLYPENEFYVLFSSYLHYLNLRDLLFELELVLDEL